MATVPRTLLITHFPPGKHNGSEQHVLAALERFSDQMVWFSTKGSRSLANPEVPDAQNLPVPWACGYVPRRPSKEPFRSWRIHFTLDLWARKLARDAARFGRRHGVEQVWGSLNLEAVVAAREAARILRVPLVVTAFDDPPTTLRYNGYRPSTLRVFEKNFSRTLGAARSIGVISKIMAEDYADRHGVDARVLYLGVDPSNVLEPPQIEERSEPLIIGSVGSIPSRPCWSALKDAVSMLNGRLGRRAVRILHIGELKPELRGPDIEVTGWIKGEELRRQLGRFDVCFLHIWFEDVFAYPARMAFPTKIGSYLESQRPIVAFGPADSLVVRLVEQEGMGITCTTKDPAQLADAIEALFFDHDRYNGALGAMKKMAATYSRDHYFAAVESFLGRADQD